MINFESTGNRLSHVNNVIYDTILDLGNNPERKDVFSGNKNFKENWKSFHNQEIIRDKVFHYKLSARLP